MWQYSPSPLHAADRITPTLSPRNSYLQHRVMRSIFSNISLFVLMCLYKTTICLCPPPSEFISCVSLFKTPAFYFGAETQRTLWSFFSAHPSLSISQFVSPNAHFSFCRHRWPRQPSLLLSSPVQSTRRVRENIKKWFRGRVIFLLKVRLWHGGLHMCAWPRLCKCVWVQTVAHLCHHSFSLRPFVSPCFLFRQRRELEVQDSGYRLEQWLLTSERILMAQWITHTHTHRNLWQCRGSSGAVLRKEAYNWSVCEIWGDREETFCPPPTASSEP